MVLGGALPFETGSRDRNTLYAKIKRGDYTFDHSTFKGTSEDALDLITRLLQKDPK